MKQHVIVVPSDRLIIVDGTRCSSTSPPLKSCMPSSGMMGAGIWNGRTTSIIP